MERKKMKKMVDIVVGGQWGSEGKGHVCAYIAPEYKHLVRTGAPNAGHTFYHNFGRGREKFVFNIIPCGAVTNPDAKIYIAAGALIEIDVLQREMEVLQRLGVLVDSNGGRRIFIDKDVKIIFPYHQQTEKDRRLFDRIGSTQHGVGACMVDKIWRSGEAISAGNRVDIMDLTSNVAPMLYDAVNKGERILMEGTQ